jgi:hypothetical protein
MIGQHLDRVARWLVRIETYEIVLAPAIADLQHEGRLGTWPRVRAYAATWRTIGAAVCAEIVDDARNTVRAGSVGPAVGVALVTLFGLTFLLLLPITLNIWKSMPWHHAALLIPLWHPTFTAWAIPVAVVPAAATLAAAGARRARRGALVLAVMIGLLLLLTNRMIEYKASDLRREFIFASAFARGEPELSRRPLWTLRETFRGRLDALKEQDRAARQRFPARHSTQEVALDANVFGATLLGLTSCALFGVAWSRRSRRWIVALTGAVFVMHALFDAGIGFLYVRKIYSGATIWWARSMLFFLTACLLTMRAAANREPEQHEPRT